MNDLPTGMVVLVVGVHTWVCRAHWSRAAEALDVRDARPLLVGGLHALTEMTVPFARTRFVTRVAARVTPRRTAMSLRLHCSLRNTNGTYRTMSKTKLNRNGWRAGVRLLGIQSDPHDG